MHIFGSFLLYIHGIGFIHFKSNLHCDILAYMSDISPYSNSCVYGFRVLA